VFHYRKADGNPLAYSTQATLLQPLRAFFKWLAVENHILYNPAADLDIPRRSAATAQGVAVDCRRCRHPRCARRDYADGHS
jgi:site-specific recombinase XerD